MKAILSAGFILAAGAALAQDIGVKMSAIGPGSYAIYKVGGQTYTHVFAGTSGAYHLYDVVPGRDPNALEGRSRYFRDSSGQVVKWVMADGATVTFSPHNCQRTVGRCTFVESGVADGEPYKTEMIRTNTPTRNGFTFEQIATGPDGRQHLMMSGTVQLDANGIVRKATLRNAETTSRFRRIRAVLR